MALTYPKRGDLQVPQEHGAREYRYTIVNDRTVLVDPGTHRIIQIIE